MKTSHLLTLIVAVATLSTLSLNCNSYAQDDAPNEKKAKKAKNVKAGRPGAVKAALSQIEFLSEEKPNTRAKYFIYLESASWCGPCRAEMPKIVEEYEVMKKAKVELILVSADRTAEDALKFRDDNKGSFPVLLGSEYGTEDSLPGLVKAGGIPNMTIVDAKGKTVKSGHPSSLLECWKELCK